MNTIQQISVFVENKQGSLTAVTNALCQNNIDMRSLNLADTSDFGILRLIVNKPEEACKVIQEAGYIVSMTPVVGAKVDDTPGGLAKAMNAIVEAGLNIEYMYAFVNREPNCANVIFRTDDNDRCIAALQAADVAVVPDTDIYA
ncbi:MAG: amino acid-binding protein [Oscillospiraceae bacterium]|nr:amino acid-binding protein [Ruminococcus sp.]MBQ4346446.1 amino acid-binding protein [Oscillospiraceae bacterium]